MSENCFQRYRGQTKHSTLGAGTGINIYVLRGVLATEESGWARQDRMSFLVSIKMCRTSMCRTSASLWSHSEKIPN